MKTLRYRLFSIVLLVVFVLGTSLPAVRTASGSGLSADGDHKVYLPRVLLSLPPIIPDTTQVLSATTTDQLSTVSGDGAVYTFNQSTPDLAALAPGDVMVSKPNDTAIDGFLRKVNSISVVNGKTVVQTKAAMLEDAVQQGEAQVSQALTLNQVRSIQNAEGVTLSPQSFASPSGAFYVKIEGVVLYDDDKNLETKNDQVTADGSIEMTPTINFAVRIQNWQLDRFLASVSLHDKIEITVKSKTSLKEFKPEPKTIAKMTLNPITCWIGWVPVVFTPILTFEVGIEGELYVAVTAKVTQEATLTGGVKYENSQWSPISAFTNEFGFEPPTISGNLEIKAYAGPRIKLMLYGVAGPELKLDGYAKLEIQASLPPAETFFTGKLYGGIGLSVKVKVELLGKKIYDYEFPDILGWKILIVQWPPASPAVPSPANEAVGQALNAGLTWAASEPAESDLFQGYLTYDVYFESGDNTPDVLASSNQTGTTYNPGSLTPETQYYWQIFARGLFGMTTAGPVWSFTTRLNHAPYAPSNPSPASGAVNQALSATLGWTGSDPDGDALTYDVYLGTNASELGDPVSVNQTATSYHPALLNTNTQYYWKIVARDRFGAATTGPLWSFTTARSVWSGSGPGTINVVSDGTTSDPLFTYSLDPAGWNPVTWEFITVADHTGPVTLGYDYSGSHAWYRVTAFLRAIVNGSPVSTLVNDGPVDCCTPPSGGFAYSGSVTFHVNVGDTYGFQFGGSNQDSNNFLNGSLKITLPPGEWNTFLGAAGADSITGITEEPTSGSVYVAGTSGASWGLPINPYTGGTDAFVAKLDHYGNLVWNTFLGSAADDHANGITIDGNGDIYIAGDSRAAWGAPLGPYTGGQDGFLAKLNSSGVLQWNRFMGSTADDSAIEIVWGTYETIETIFVAGNSDGAWGEPYRPFAGGTDVFSAEYNTSGGMGFMTFLGSPGQDEVGGLAIDNHNRMYVTGTSDGTWGTPVSPYTGGTDAFLADLSDGVFLTFMGSPGNDHANGIVITASGNKIVVGDSHSGWGPSADSYAGGTDAFVATFNGQLALLQNSFLGSTGDDHANGIVKTQMGELEQFVVAGDSSAVWGSPVGPYMGGTDGFIANLTGDLALLRNTFLGSAGDDRISSIVVDSFIGNEVVAGSSGAAWGSPILPHAGGMDGFVAYRR